MIAASRAIGGAAVLKMTPRPNIRKAVTQYHSANRGGLHILRNRRPGFWGLFIALAPYALFSAAFYALTPLAFSAREIIGNIFEARRTKKIPTSLIVHTAAALTIGGGCIAMSAVFAGALEVLPQGLYAFAALCKASAVLAPLLGVGMLIGNKIMEMRAHKRSLGTLERALGDDPAVKNTILAEIEDQGLPWQVAGALQRQLNITSKGVVV